MGRTLSTYCLLGIVWLLFGACPAGADSRKEPGGEIKTGKWVGYLKPEGTTEAIALTMDSFLLKPDSVKESERRVLVFKLSLGGYQSTEYETQTFENLDYDFDLGSLTLDDPHNEMVISAVVYSNPVQMEGTVYLRSAAMRGTLKLDFVTDEPEDEPDDGKPARPMLVPKLAGQYEGVCAGKKAVLQLETAKGLSSDSTTPTTGLHHYLITGVVGVENGLCPRVNPPSRPNWCVDHAFSSGSHDFYQGKLSLSGTLETEECTREGDEFSCRMRLLPKEDGPLVEETCRFRKTQSSTTELTVYPRRFHVSATAEQKLPLPTEDPPASKALVDAAKGSFYGYLHHETMDRYEPLRLDISATTSSVHPHIPSNVFASVSAVLGFGRQLTSAEYWAQQFNRRSLYLVPGYTLMSDESDTFLQVTEWKQGFISGIWFSRSFGRVGSFEVVKSAKLPDLSPSAKMVGGIAGRFLGPLGNEDKDYMDLRVVVPKQPRFAEKSYLIFQGNYQLVAGGVPWPIKKIARGSYDIYTGAVGWNAEAASGGEMTLVTGYSDGPIGLKVFWPNDRNWAVGVFDRVLGSLNRTP